jgi:ApaG protein
MSFEATTRGVRITAEPSFLGAQSDPAAHKYVWSYRIEIVNEGDQTVQLTARHWVITDGRGLTQMVDGPGVVGEQPILRPGDSFTYTSGCPLGTPSGVMAGHYDMVTDSGEVFAAQVPAFSLDSPHDVRVVN